MVKKNILIYGYSVLGMKIAHILQDKEYQITIADYDEKSVKKAQEDGFNAYHLTLLNDSELVDIKIGSGIDSLFCVSSSDTNNLFVTLSARNLDKNLKIVSIAKTRSECKKFMMAGATKVLNPNELSALRVFRYLTKPKMLEVLDEILFNKSNLQIAEIYIEKNSKLNGTFLINLSLHKQFNILLLGIMDHEISNKFIFNTRGINHKIDEGDILVIVGDTRKIEEFKQSLEQK